MSNNSKAKPDIYHFVGKILSNRYQIDEFIDEGGMGIVYKGVDISARRDVAIKILHPKFSLTSNKEEFYLKQFLRACLEISNLDV